MNFDLKNSTTGEKIILGSACLAIISLFMPWVTIFGISANGFQQQGYFLLILFLYPVITILTGKPMNKMVGIVCGAIGIAFMIYFINSKSGDLFGTTISTAAAGMYVCVASLIMLVIGSFMSQK